MMKGARSYSVVIAAYNAGATIVAAVQSCLQQRLSPLEVIVVDDGSTDQTVSLLRQHFGEGIRIIHLPRNSGPSAARNAGIAAAKGSHIVFQDADDVWHPEKLALIDQVLEDHPDIRFLFHPFTLGSLDFMPSPAQLIPVRYPLGRLLLRNVIGTPCTLIERTLAPHFNEDMRYMEDYELFLRLAADAGVYRIDAALTRLGRPVLSAGGQSARKWAMRKGEIQALWLFVKRHPRWLPALPFLIVFSLIKFLLKAIRGRAGRG